MKRAGVSTLLGVVSVAASSAALSQPGPRQPRAYFVEQAGLHESEIREVESGRAVAKIVDTGEKPEVVIFGAVFVRAPVEAFLAKYRDVESFQNLDGYLAVGSFSDPPRPSDVAAVVLDDEDVDALEACKPGECDVQLPAASIVEFKESVDWSSPNAAEEANALAREKLVALIERYRSEGNAALGAYNDKGYELAVAETFETVLGRVEGLAQYLPEVRAYLLDYPRVALPDTDEIFYWEIVDFGLKPTLRVNHLMIHQAKTLMTSPNVVVNKQLYASHYFQVAVDFWLCVKDSTSDAHDGFFLITEKASRQHGLTGLKGSVARRIVVPRARDAMENALQSIRDELERSARDTNR